MQEIASFWAKEVLSVAIYTPIVYFFMGEMKRQNDNHIKNIKKGFSDLADSIGRNTPPSNAAIIDMGSKYMLSTTRLKTDFIRERLLKNNLNQRQEIIKSQIKNKIVTINNEKVVHPLNNYRTSVGLLGDWIHNNFQMENFLEEVYDVVFREDTEIERKISDIYTLMEGYDTEMWENLKSLLDN